MRGIRRATMSTTSSAVASGSSTGKRKKSGCSPNAGGWPALIRCALTTTPDSLGLAEDLRQPYPGDGVGGEQVAQHLAGADRGQLVDVADQQQVRARRRPP